MWRPSAFVIPSEARDLDRGEILPPRPRSLASLGMTDSTTWSTRRSNAERRGSVRRDTRLVDRDENRPEVGLSGAVRNLVREILIERLGEFLEASRVVSNLRERLVPLGITGRARPLGPVVVGPLECFLVVRILAEVEQVVLRATNVFDEHPDRMRKTVRLFPRSSGARPSTAESSLACACSQSSAEAMMLRHSSCDDMGLRVVEGVDTLPPRRDRERFRRRSRFANPSLRMTAGPCPPPPQTTLYSPAPPPTRTDSSAADRCRSSALGRRESLRPSASPRPDRA